MRIVRLSHLHLVYLLLILIPIQIYLAGRGAFGGGFNHHETFGFTAIHFSIILVLITGAIGRVGWRQFWLALAMNVVFALQILVIESDEPWVAGLHALIGFSYWPYAYFALLPSARRATARSNPAAE